MLSKRNFRFSIYDFFKIDRQLLFTVLIILCFGCLMVYDASVFYANQNFDFKFHFLILQLGWITIGLILAFFASIISLDFVKDHANILFIATIAILIFILLPTPFSPEIYGARRWLFINPPPLPGLPFLGIVGFQPSELAKLVGIIFGAAYFSSVKFKNETLSKISRNYIFIVVGLAVLIAEEPDFTTAFITFIILIAVAFYAYAPIKTFIMYFGPAILAAVIYARSSPYRMERITTLFKPEDIDKLGSGYHIRQIMIALGSGGLLGLGFGNSRQKYAYLPEVIGDSIFAIVGEELGFIGGLALIGLFCFFIYKCFYIAEHSKTKFGELIAKGVGTWFALQAMINLLAMVRLMPLSGVPMPLISYGGSSTIFMLIGIGLVMNVSKDLYKK